MRRGSIAEGVLRLVMSRERAAAAAGDLLEDSAGRDPSWFWMSIAGTMVSALWCEMRNHGWRLAGVAAAAFFFLMILGFGANLALWVVWKTVHVVRDHTGLELLLPGDSLPVSVPLWVAAFYLRLLAPFAIGQWAARRAPGRELSVWFVMLLLWPLLAGMTKTPYNFAWPTLFSLLGVIYERWRANRLERLTPN